MLKRREIMTLSMMMVTRMMRRTMVLRNVVELQRWLREMMSRERMMMIFENGAVEEEDRSQDLGPHSVGACAVNMHVDMSEEPLCVDMCKKECPSPQPGSPLCDNLRSPLHNKISQEPL